ncbi:hypothetical protein M422DRAFT_173820 [Sphaerobolus stellatus SS14]|uniref:F-box domain-containing protein n=1 Tax=Sphaerobolus stellatus (strain SS14) TaxID=990650 RepID=A0A0C9UBG2_SPHS4|nr:hypothetical protein M422DRAFT_173820 [Sphaerobolus stellatus SS14]
MALANLPKELLEYIFNNIDEVGDLLSLALACRILCVLIIPWHINYRWFSSNPGRKKLWRTLIINFRLAARIRNLEFSAVRI